MNNALDWIETAPVKDLRPRNTSGRTHLQIVIGVEDTWLATYLVPTDVYLCPSVALANVRRGGTR